ncbi:MAG: hypothetical protein ACKOUM_08555, partial [Sphingopyxis sp.]
MPKQESPVDRRGAMDGAWLFLCGPADAVAASAASTPAALADLLRRSGLADAGDDGAPAMPPRRLRLGDTSIPIAWGDDAAALLRASGAEMAGNAPEMAQNMVLALSIDLPPAQRCVGAQRLCAAAAMLVSALPVEHLYWSPAQLWSAAAPFQNAVVAQDAHGVPPVLHLVQFYQDGPSLLATMGLRWFNGQELRVQGPGGMAGAELMRRAARLAIAGMVNGPYAVIETVPGLDGGEDIRLTPVV